MIRLYPAYTLAMLLLAAFPARSDVAYLIDTAAGSDLVGDNGPATSAQLTNARGLAFDRQGNLYVADTDNHRIRKISSSGTISTLAGTGHPGFSGDLGPANVAQLNSPYGLAADAAGNVYVADFGNQRVRRISTDGIITTIAGTGQKGSAGDGGPAAAAQLMSPRNLVFDSVGNLYVSEFEGHRVRKLSRDGAISTIAGTGGAGLNLEPKQTSMPAVAAQLAYPAGLAVDSFDNVYVADSRNNMVRRISNGVILTVLDGRSDPAFLLFSPTGLAIDPSGFIYVTDSTAFVRQVYGGQLRSVAGTGDRGYSGDGKDATLAKLTGPHDLVFDAKGSLYISDGAYIRKVSGGSISTVAGNGYAWAVGDSLPATLAQLKSPAGLALDPAGNLYIADTGTARIRKVDTGGNISTVAGTGQTGFDGDGRNAALTQLSSPGGVAADSSGNLYIADTKNNRVRKVLPSGIIFTVAGNGTPGWSADNTFAPAAALNQPRAVAVDPNGVLYIADTGNHRILRVTAGGTIVTVAGNGSPGSGGDNGRAPVAQLNGPTAIAFDRSGNLYIADTFNHLIRKVSTEAIITTVAGGSPGAALNYPGGVAVDANGAIYIADTWNHRIRMLDTTGAIRVIAGIEAPGYAGDGDAAATAQLNYPSGIVVDAAGAIYFADTFNNRVRRLTAQTVVVPPAAIVDAMVVNTASLQPGPVAPGELATIFAAGIGPETGIEGHTNAAGTMDTALGETQVFFDGTPAPLFFVQSGRINLQVPYTAGGTAHVDVQYKGVSRLKLTLAVADSAPGIFPAIWNQDGTQNGAQNPAARDSIVTLYATGEGVTNPSAVTGAIAQPPFGQPALPVSLKIGGNTADIVYAGSAPGQIGVMQINARVPGGFAPSGLLPVVLQVGAASSQSGVTIWVR